MCALLYYSYYSRTILTVLIVLAACVGSGPSRKLSKLLAQQVEQPWIKFAE